MRRRAAGPAALLLFLLAGLCRSAPAAAADAFYEGLAETGISAYSRNDFATAAQDLRLASFGLLEEPARLAECLTYLAVAQAEVADVDAFTHTIDRLLEVEHRFRAYSSLTIDTSLHQALEKHLLSLTPPDVLERSQVFRELGRRKRQAEILRMPPADRRLELERRIAAEPGYAPWRLAMAELDFAEENFESAWTGADALLQQGTPSARVQCLRGRCGAALGRCEQALQDLDSCDLPEARNELIEARLRCHLALQDTVGAESVLAELSADERQSPPFRRLVRQIERAGKGTARTPDTDAPPTTTEPVAAAAPEAADPGDSTAAEEPESTAEAAAPAPPPAAEAVRLELERLEAMAQTRSLAELQVAFDAIRELADREPQLAEPQRLAAMIAYRLSRWEDVVTYSRRAGEPESPDSQFYLSVALWESGEGVAAREMLERCLPSLEPTDFVRGYAAKILETAPPPEASAGG